MRILVCGGREYWDMVHVWAVLDTYKDQMSCLINGDADGADVLSHDWAHDHDVPHEEFPAQWREHGRSAGPIRNRDMLKYGQPDLVIAFPGRRGTADMIRIARDAGIPVVVERKP